MNGDYYAPETDNINYYLGLKNSSIHMVNVGPPYAEEYPKKYKEAIETFHNNVDSLENIQEMNVKEIESKIYEETGINYEQNIFNGKVIKQVGFNYRVLHEMAYLGGECTLCRTGKYENAEHLFIQCESLALLRREVTS